MSNTNATFAFHFFFFFFFESSVFFRMALMSTANYKPGLLALDERPPRVWDRGGRDAGTSGAAGRNKKERLKK